MTVIPNTAQSFQLFVEAAAGGLVAEGWKLLKRDDAPDADWHLIAKKGHKLRIVQVSAPATSTDARQDGRQRLGENVRLPGPLGTMEQWLAHVRPDGHVTFGPYVLNAQHWADTNGDALQRLGIAA